MNALEIQLVEIIKTATSYGVFCQTTKRNDDLIAFRVWGFSKSGTVEVFIEDGKIQVLSRYDRLTTINNFRDLADIAWDWYIDYKDRPEYEKPDPYWAEYFKESNWL